MKREKKIELQYKAVFDALEVYKNLVVGGLGRARSKKTHQPYSNALYGVDSTFQALPNAKVQYLVNKRGKKR